MDDNTVTVDQLRRKADRAWELAGLARSDRDMVDCKRWTDEARRLEDMIREHEDHVR